MDRDLASYIPQDRRRALASASGLPDRCRGAVLFADISGFTPLAEGLDRALGARHGAEALTRQLSLVYEALIVQVERFGGSVVGFAGDAITCWFDGGEGRGDRDEGLEKASSQCGAPEHSGPAASPHPLAPAALRAAACALALQRAMRSLDTLPLPGGAASRLAIKVAVASGPARRLAVGDPAIQRLDVLAGAALARVSAGEHLASSGEVLVDEPTAAALDAARIRGWRTAAGGERFAVLEELAAPVEGVAPAAPALPDDLLRPWLLPAVYERHSSGLGDLLPELRPAVVLFLQFGAISYDEDPDAGAWLDGFVRRVQALLTRYGGALLHLSIGDKGSYLLGAFGVPTAHEDDARRAARAALDLLALGSEVPSFGPLRLGISRGVIYAGAYGGSTRRTYGILGDEVNLAARLMQRAGPGEALVSARAQPALAVDFDLEPLAPMTVKGMPEPLMAFHLAGERTRAARLSEPSYALPMVGRAAELEVIAARLELVLAGHGQIVAIVGEAGMGKSRLLAEVIRLARRSGAAGYGSACQSYGTTSPYLLWGPIWRALFDLDPGAPLRRQLRALETAVEEWAPERRALLPLLGPLLGLALLENDITCALEPQFRKSALETLLLECLHAAAREAAEDGGALLFVLEDLHWIDPASRELLQLVGEAIVDLPVLIALAYRPAAGAPDEAALPQATRVELAPLTAAEAEQAIRAKLAQLLPERKVATSPALVARITEWAQGNPFFLEELLNYLRDCGIDPQDTAAVEALELPSSLHRLVLSRIDQLRAAQQAELKVASVIGRQFRFAWLHGAFPMLGQADRLKADLDELAWLDLTPLYAAEPELAYLFKHIVTQEVAYESLTAEIRAALHEQLADFLEAILGDAVGHHLDLLAYHYDRSSNEEKRRSYLRRAGEAAAARFANAAAVEYFSRALAATPESDRAGRYELLLCREQVAELQGDRQAQLRDLAELETLATTLGDERRQAEAAGRRLLYLSRVGDYEGAIDVARKLVPIALAAGAPEIAVRALDLWAWSHLKQGDHDGARVQADACLALSRQAGDRRGAARALNDLAAVAYARADYGTAREATEQSLAICREIRDRRGEAAMLANLGYNADAEEDDRAAREAYRESLAICREIGDRRGEAAVLKCLAEGSFAVGELAAAREYCQQSLEIRRRIGERDGEARALSFLGLLAVIRGDYGAGEAYSRQALELARAIGYRPGIAEALTVSGHAKIGIGDAVGAGGAYREAFDIRRSLDDGARALEARAGLAGACLACGAVAEATEHASAIVPVLLQGATAGAVEPLRAYLTTAQVLRAAGDPQALALLAAGYERLQARAAKITDAELQRSLLDVPYHRELIALWTAAEAASEGVA